MQVEHWELCYKRKLNIGLPVEYDYRDIVQETNDDDEHALFQAFFNVMYTPL